MMKYLNISLTCLVIYLLFDAFANNNGYYDFVKVKNKNQELEKIKTNLIQNNYYLSSQIINLKTKKLIYMEPYLRRDLHMIKENEVFYSFINLQIDKTIK